MFEEKRSWEDLEEEKGCSGFPFPFTPKFKLQELVAAISLSSQQLSQCLPVSVELDILGGLEGEMVVVVLIHDSATERWYFYFFSLLVRGCCWALNLLGSYSCPYFKKHGSIQFLLSKRLYFLIKYFL